jgi:hypothetical protein
MFTSYLYNLLKLSSKKILCRHHVPKDDLCIIHEPFLSEQGTRQLLEVSSLVYL